MILGNSFKTNLSCEPWKKKKVETKETCVLESKKTNRECK